MFNESNNNFQNRMDIKNKIIYRKSTCEKQYKTFDEKGLTRILFRRKKNKINIKYS